MIFRFIFITAVGTVGYDWIDPGSISDAPLAQLTLGQLIGKALAVGISLGCICWFFTFPNAREMTNARMCAGPRLARGSSY
jgi:hypothetical protein